MKKYDVSLEVTGSKYVGEVEAEDLESLLDQLVDDERTGVSMCWQCSSECEDARVSRVFVYAAGKLVAEEEW